MFYHLQTHIEAPTAEPIRSDYEDENADGDVPDYNSQDEVEVLVPESTNGAPLLPRHDDEIEEDKPSNYSVLFSGVCTIIYLRSKM